MTDCRDADCLVVIGELVDDAVGADAQRTQAMEPAAEHVSDVWVSFVQSQRVFDGVDQRPVEVEELLAGAPGENNFRHASASGSTLAELVAKIVERDAISSDEIGEAGFDGGERRRVGENLGGLLQRFVFVDGNERGSWLAIAGHEDVIATISDVAE